MCANLKVTAQLSIGLFRRLTKFDRKQARGWATPLLVATMYCMCSQYGHNIDLLDYVTGIGNGAISPCTPCPDP